MSVTASTMATTCPEERNFIAFILRFFWRIQSLRSHVASWPITSFSSFSAFPLLVKDIRIGYRTYTNLVALATMMNSTAMRAPSTTGLPTRIGRANLAVAIEAGARNAA
jgi:hypothetical protein